MPSLHEILAAQAPLLVLDAASSRIQAGWLEGAGTGRWESSDEEAGIGLFRCLEALGADLDAVRAFAFCSGPGSILGIRTVAMALRAWQVGAPRPIYAYGSLALAAAADGAAPRSMIADARREFWHLYRPGTGLVRVGTPEVPAGAAMPDGFRHWKPLPPGTGQVSYTLAELLPRTAGQDLFTAVEAPDAFLHEEPNYATWTPQVHQAP